MSLAGFSKFSLAFPCPFALCFHATNITNAMIKN
jgi:hypothetical protein